MGSRPLTLYLIVGLVLLPLIGNLVPSRVSFLVAMRYYAGNWAWNAWLFRGDSYKNLTKVKRASPLFREQLERFAPHEAATIDSRGMAFRSLHLQWRTLGLLLPKAIVLSVFSNDNRALGVESDAAASASGLEPRTRPANGSSTAPVQGVVHRLDDHRDVDVAAAGRPFGHADGWVVPSAMFTSVMRSLIATVSVPPQSPTQDGRHLLNRKHAAADRPAYTRRGSIGSMASAFDAGVGEASVESVPGAATVGALEDAGRTGPRVECAGRDGINGEA